MHDVVFKPYHFKSIVLPRGLDQKENEKQERHGHVCFVVFGSSAGSPPSKEDRFGRRKRALWVNSSVVIPSSARRLKPDLDHEAGRWCSHNVCRLPHLPTHTFCNTHFLRVTVANVCQCKLHRLAASNMQRQINSAAAKARVSFAWIAWISI